VTTDSHTEAVRSEFGRTASFFTERTAGRFDALDVVPFSRLRSGASVLEVGVGTGVFLDLFEEVAGAAFGIDLTEAMLVEARRLHQELLLAAGDGHKLPLRSKSVDLASSAQTLHHVPDPLPFVRELRRVTRADGYVLVVDQVATERFEEALMMTQLETLRDPSHVTSRSPSAMRTMLMSAGLEIVDERLVESRESFNSWMRPTEFPADRIAKTREFIDRLGAETGMDFRMEGDDLTFARRRLALLARRGK
jgi:ubiquinone/menaquinone biosynthesis C-methylase UbiE